MTTLAQITEVRKRSGAGILDCKKALADSNGDIQGALDWLRKKGLATAAKKAGRTAAEGFIAVAQEQLSLAAIELNCETDFAARNEEFKALAIMCAQEALAHDMDAKSLLDAKVKDKALRDSITDLIAKIGENVQLRRVRSLSVSNGYLESYLHNRDGDQLGRIVSAVAIHTQASCRDIADLGRKLAMHIASQHPLWLKPEDVDPASLEREKTIIREQALTSGKPENVIEKMMTGRLQKFYDENCLLRQTSIFDSSQRIQDLVNEMTNKVGAKLEVTGFLRLEVGEGIEKESEDFATAVQQSIA